MNSLVNDGLGYAPSHLTPVVHYYFNIYQFSANYMLADHLFPQKLALLAGGYLSLLWSEDTTFIMSHCNRETFRDQKPTQLIVAECHNIIISLQWVSMAPLLKGVLLNSFCYQKNSASIIELMMCWGWVISGSGPSRSDFVIRRWPLGAIYTLVLRTLIP